MKNENVGTLFKTQDKSPFISFEVSLPLCPARPPVFPPSHLLSLSPRHDPWGMGIFTRQIQTLLGTRDPTLPLSIPVHVLISTPSHPVSRPPIEQRWLWSLSGGGQVVRNVATFEARLQAQNMLHLQNTNSAMTFLNF